MVEQEGGDELETRKGVRRVIIASPPDKSCFLVLEIPKIFFGKRQTVYGRAGALFSHFVTYLYFGDS